MPEVLAPYLVLNHSPLSPAPERTQALEADHLVSHPRSSPTAFVGVDV